MHYLSELNQILNDKQTLELSLDPEVKSYILLRVEGKSRKEASESAGINDYRAKKIDEDEQCIIYAASIKKIVAAVTGITESYVLASLQRVYERAMTPTYVETKTGGYDKYDLGPALKALEMMGKHLGMFSEKVDVSVNHEVKLVDAISKEQALKAIEMDVLDLETIEIKTLEESK